MNEIVVILCIVIGLITAIIGSLLGLGGGILLVPVLLLLYTYVNGFEWATPQAAVGISLISMVFTAFASTISNYRSKLVHIKVGIYYLIGGLPGSIIGSYLNGYVHVDNFPIYFGSLQIIISLLFFIKPNKDREAKPVSPLIPILLSLGIGTMSGLFGIGGGSMIVPTMILLFGIPIHIAIATSLFIITFMSTIGAGTHITLGHIPWNYVSYFVVTAFIGGIIGAKINHLLKGRTIEWILRIFLMFIGLYLIIDKLI